MNGGKEFYFFFCSINNTCFLTANNGRSLLHCCRTTLPMGSYFLRVILSLILGFLMV